MAVVSPPKPPSPDELQALIEEARGRQRRRRLITAFILLGVISAGVAAYLVVMRSGFVHTGAHGHRPVSTRPHLTPSQLVLVGSHYSAGQLSQARERPEFQVGNVLVAANPATGTCRLLSRLPDYAGHASARANRIAYAPTFGRAKWLWVGRVGGKLRRIYTGTIATDAWSQPHWVGKRIAQVNGARIRLVGGGSIAPALPPHAQIVEVAPHGNRIAVYATWGGFDLRGALFMVANSKTRRIENERFPVGEAPEPVWSPNGNRIAILRNTDLWTIEPDGDNPVRLTHSGRVGGVVWSPDSETIAYTYTPMHMTRWGRQPDVPNVYVRSASGGPAHRLTYARKVPLRRYEGTSPPFQGARPVAWLGNELAVRVSRGFGIIRASGGAMQPLCGSYWPIAGVLSWRR